MVHSPTDAAVDDTTLSCVLRDAGCTRADAEAFFTPSALVRVAGLLHLPDRPGDGIVLEVSDVAEDGEDFPEYQEQLADVVPQAPDSVTTSGGKCLLKCSRPDSTEVWHIIAPTNGAHVTAYNEALIPWPVDHLNTQG